MSYRRRIVGQCHQADFASIEHLSSVLDTSGMLDTSTLTSGQKFACYFSIMTREKGVPWKLVRSVVREVLFWGEDSARITHTEVKFVRNNAKVGDIQKFRALW